MDKENLNRPVWQRISKLEAQLEADYCYGIASMKNSSYGKYWIVEYETNDGTSSYQVVLVTEAGYMVVGRIDEIMVFYCWHTNSGIKTEYTAKYYFPKYTFGNFVDWIIEKTEKRMNELNACLEVNS